MTTNPTSPTFINQITGIIYIDQTGSDGINNFIATFTNAGKINIGGTMAIGERGIYNLATTFSNTTDGEINIDQTTSDGFGNGLGTFTNVGKINIGSTGSIGGEGIFFTTTPATNDTDGEININRTADHGLSHFNQTFNNLGKINIGNIAAISGDGIYNTGATFNNQTDGEINIEQTNGSSIASIIHVPLDRASTFVNHSCAVIKSTGQIKNNSTFQNQGFIFNNFDGTHENEDTFTNQGTMEDFHGAFGGVSLTNEDLVVVPIVRTTPDLQVFPNALQIGNANSFTVSTDWYSDAALNTDAGDYNSSNNTFTSNQTLPLGEHTFYMEVTDNDNTCTQTVVVQIKVVERDVPTLSEWGLLNLALLLMICGTLYLVQPMVTLKEKQVV